MRRRLPLGLAGSLTMTATATATAIVSAVPDRCAIVEILRDTKKDLPAYFR